MCPEALVETRSLCLQEDDERAIAELKQEAADEGRKLGEFV